MRMLKYVLLVLLMVCSTIFLVGCGGASVTLLEESTEDEREDAILTYCKNRYGDTVTVEFDHKEELRVATARLDGPSGYRTVAGGYTYYYYVTPERYPDLHIEVLYWDGYILKKNFKKTEHPSNITSGYETALETYEFGLKLTDTVQQYDGNAKMKIASKNNGQYIVITYTNDFDTICEMHDKIRALMAEELADGGSNKTVGMLYTDNYGLSIDTIDFAEFPGLGSGSGPQDWIFKRLAYGHYDRFATFSAESIEDIREFYESRADMKPTWISKENATDYGDYWDIVFFERISAIEKQKVIWDAWGLYD